MQNTGSDFSAAPPPPSFGYIPPPKQPRQGRFFGRVLWWILGIIVGFVAILVIIASFFNKEITVKALNAASSSLKTEIKISDASLSLIRAFPNAAVNLSNVRMAGTFGGNLLEAEEVSLRFGLWSLFSDNIEIKKIVIRHGALNLLTDKKGQVNYDVMEPSSSKNETNVGISLNLALLEDMKIFYDDKMTRQMAKILVEKAEFAGDFSDSEYDMEARASMQVNMLEANKTRYLVGEKVAFDAIFNINKLKKVYTFQKTALTLGGNTFNLSGIVQEKATFSDINLSMESLQGDLSALFKILPAPYAGYFSDFSSEGNYTCAGTVKGRYGKKDSPALDVRFSLKNGQIMADKLQSPLRNVNFTAKINTGNGSSGSFVMDDFRADFGGEPLSVALRLNNFDNPLVDFKFDGTIPLESGYGLLGDDRISSGSGRVHLEEITLRGNYDDMRSMRLADNANLGGKVVFDQAVLKYQGQNIEIPKGTLRLSDNVFSIADLKLLLADSDFTFVGKAENLLPFLLADSVNSQKAHLDFEADMNSLNVDVDQLLALFSVPESEKKALGVVVYDSLKTAKNINRGRFTDKLRGTFITRVAAFNHNKVEARDFEGKLTFDKARLVIEGKTKAMNGTVLFEGDTYFQAAPFMRMRIRMQGLDLSETFRQCDNFDQEVLTHENIKGTLGGRLVGYFYWNEKGDFLMNNMKLYADLLAHNGEMVGVKTLEDFSTFIHIQDLKRIKFTTLQNYIEISSGRLILPVMDIASNAANMTISGTHTFNNDINYFVKVNAGQVLLNRLRNHNRDLDPLPGEHGFFNLFYSIRGTIDKYKMYHEKKLVEREFSRSQARKQEILYVLEKEFGTPASASPLDAPPSGNPGDPDKPTLETVNPNHAPPAIPDRIRNAVDKDEYLDEIEGGDGR